MRKTKCCIYVDANLQNTLAKMIYLFHLTLHVKFSFSQNTLKQTKFMDFFCKKKNKKKTQI